MSLHREIKEAVEEIGTGFEEYKSVNEERVKALESGQKSIADELDEKLARIDKSISTAVDKKDRFEKELEFQRERLEELEAAGSRPKTAQDAAKDEYKDAFFTGLRSRFLDPEQVKIVRELEAKAFDGTADASGGYAIPEQIARDIQRIENLFSPVRELVKVVQVGTPGYKEIINLANSSYAWVGETGTRNETLTESLRAVAPTFGTIYAYPKATEESLNDIFFNVEDVISEQAGRGFAEGTGIAVINGNGSNRPTGMLNTTPSSNSFATRLATQYESVTDSGAGAEVTANGIIDLTYSLNPAYLPGAAFTMRTSTAGAIRKLTDDNGQHLWQPGLASGEPDRLMGHRVVRWEDMPSVANNAHPIGFGDWRRAYTIADLQGLRLTRDEITDIGYVKFYIRRRLGGIVTNNDAVKFLLTQT